MRMKLYLISLLLIVIPLMESHAGEADVVAVKVVAQQEDTYRFDVTVSHQDEGWKHYADKWDIVGPDGTVFGTRTLLHPHVDEQPFERSLSGVKIPKDIQQITVRAHDLVHQYGGKVMVVTLP
ncbi:MAG: hypothetical protein HKP41_23815 [Desulfobacterales bacterium]|nr:hypothetical protein [Desulfobacterales bacterium]